MATHSIDSAAYLDGKPHFDELFQAEQNHFWFRHRTRVIANIIRDITSSLSDGYQVLEVGCGNGHLTEVLEQVCDRGHVTGSELFPEGLEFARTRVKCPLIQADIYDLPFGPKFDIVGMFDVLEHLPDDHRALSCLTNVLRESGTLVLTVPAHSILWSYADVASGHYRRYSTTSLRQVIESSGFKIQYFTQFMMPLFPMMMISRALTTLRNRYRTTSTDPMTLAKAEFRTSSLTNRLLSWLLSFEMPLLSRRAHLPVGTSFLVVARKRQSSIALAA